MNNHFTNISYIISTVFIMHVMIHLINQSRDAKFGLMTESCKLLVRDNPQMMC